MERFVILYSSIVRKISKFMNLIASVALVFIMFLTVADVILRLFRRPILGAYELVGLGGAVVAAFAIPQTAIERGHVAVRLLVEKLPLRVQSFVYTMVHILSGILFFLIGWESVVYGLDLKRGGEVTMTLKLPFYPVLYGIAASCWVMVLVVAADLLFTFTAGPMDWYNKWKE